MMLLYRKRCLHESQMKISWWSFVNPRKDRSSRSQMFFKIGILKNLRNFTGKHMWLQCLFNKVAALMAYNFIWKRLQQRCFPVKFRKFLRTHFSREHLWWLLLEGICEGTNLVKILQSCNFNIFEINHRCFRKMLIKKNNV